MRPHHGVRMLAALATTAGVMAPPAAAKFDNVTYPPLNSRAIVSQHHSGGSSDSLEWIAIGAAGGLVLTGVTVTARRGSRKPATSRARVASGS